MRSRVRNSDRIIIILLVVIFAVLIITNTKLITNTITEQTEQLGESQISSIKSDFENHITKVQNSLIKVANGASQFVESGDKKALERYIIEQKQSQLTATGGNTFNVYVAGEGWEIIPDFDIPPDYHGTERIWYVGAADNKGEIYITDPYIDSMTGEMCYTMSVMLDDNDTVVAMDFTFSEVQQSIEKMSLSEGSSAMISTEKGLIVGYTDMTYVGRDLKKSLPEYNSVLDTILHEGDGEPFTATVNGKTCSVFYSVTNNNWYMILCVNNYELNKTAIIRVFVNVVINLIMLGLIVFLYLVGAGNRKKMERALKTREDFVQNLIGRLKEPVDGIIRESNRPAEYKENLDSFKALGLRLSEIMTDLTAYSSIVSKNEDEGKKKRSENTDISRSIRVIRNTIVGLLFAIMIFSSYSLYELSRTWTGLMIKDEADTYMDRFKEWELEQEAIINVFTDPISIQPELLDNYDKAVEWLDNLSKKYPSISVCYIANPYKEHTVIMNNGWQPDDDWKVEEREWYKKTEKSRTGMSISAPYLDAQTGNYCITISKIVYSTKNQFLGIFGIDLYIDKMIDVFGDSYGEDNYAFLVDINGDILNHPSNEYQMSGDKKVNIQNTGYLKAYDNSGVITIAKDYDGKSICMISQTDENTGFSVVMIMNWWNSYGVAIILISIYVLVCVAGSIAIIILINKVIRSQAAMNMKLTEAAKKATDAGMAKSDFLARMSHEIRTPINAVIGMNEMIMRETNEPQIMDYAADIKSASKTLLELINGILDFSKIESGKLDIVPDKYETASLIDNIVNMIEKRAEKKDLELKLDIDENIPKALYGDDVRIRQVLTNLLTNAVKYTENGYILLTMRVENITEDECMLYIAVKDTGIGIKQEDMDKLFQSFKRIDEIRNKNIEGTGLGMSIVEGILGLMDSKLSVESEYGKGSVFSFRIKQKVIDATALGSYHRNMSHSAEGRVAEISKAGNLIIKNADILVVDDNSMNLKVAKGLMKKLNVVPDLAGSGKEAVGRVRGKHYDIILMDHMMPKMDGIETLAAIKSENLIGEDTAVIALTANAISGARQMYLSKGFNDYISKPIDPKELENILIRYLPKEKYGIGPADKGNGNANLKSDGHSDKESRNMNLKSDDRSDKESGNMYLTHAGSSAGEIVAQGYGTEGSDYESDFLRSFRQAGFDTHAAMNYCMNDEDFFREMLTDFAKAYDEKKTELASFYDGKDWKDYQIKVHALKSSSKTIGAMELSAMALEQEMAAKEDKIDVINNGFAPLIEEYAKVYQDIVSIIDISEGADDEVLEFQPDDEEDAQAGTKDEEVLEFQPDDEKDAQAGTKDDEVLEFLPEDED